MVDEGEDWVPCEECMDADGDHMVEEYHRIAITDDYTLERLMEEIDNVEAALIERPV
jgi:hypothetical protein